MNTQNKYKAALEILADKAVANKYKLIYEKGGEIYGSETGTPSEHDFCITMQPTSKKLTKAPVVPVITETVKESTVEHVVEELAIEAPAQPKPVAEVSNKRRAKAAIVETATKVENEPTETTEE